MEEVPEVTDEAPEQAQGHVRPCHDYVLFPLPLRGSHHGLPHSHPPQELQRWINHQIKSA